MTDTDRPLQVFNFEITFKEFNLLDAQEGAPVDVCRGAFSEVTGLEATMEPKVIKEGGRNYGAVQRPGPVTFSTVVLKRGMTGTRDAWTWFNLVANGSQAGRRRNATISMRNETGTPVVVWLLRRAMPIKFKAADLNAAGSNVGIEELHIVHEGLQLVSSDAGPRAAGKPAGGTP